MSNIKITVEWEESVVFAGEEVRCIISFKNSSPVLGRSRSLSPYVNGQHESGRDRWKQDLPKQQPLPKRAQSLRKGDDKNVRLQIKGHRPAMSLGGSALSRDSFRGPSVAGPATHGMMKTRVNGRSLSIVSLASNAADEDAMIPPDASGPQTRRYHSRAASLQILPMRSSGSNINAPPALHPPHRLTDSTFRKLHDSDQGRDGKAYPKTASAGTIPENGRPRINSRTSPNLPDSLSNTFHRAIPTRSSTSNTIKASPTIPFSPPNQNDNYNSSFVSKNKVLSPISQTATPRSSLELYSQSNLSTETLASEYVLPPQINQSSKSAPRKGTHLSPFPGQVSKTETLMMGYVQLTGSFTLDGSLIDMAPFESIKLKGVIGGQGGGGVVGVEKSKRDSGLLGSFGWGGLGQSLSGFIGGQEMSSIKEMKGIASNKAIPIISTPHSILFVNLSLQPGESRSFSYSHRLPDDIPPTYKGRAIKIEYQLVIGTQRPQQSLQTQSIRHADFGFKVFSGVTPRGELPIYNLKVPHIILKDIAISRAVETDGSIRQRLKQSELTHKSETDMNFITYLDKLLNEGKDLDGGLLSPTQTRSYADSDFSGRYSAKDLIELAIIRGNASTPTKSNTNRFDIHRGGQRVATIMLARSAYRLGERLIAGLDFREALLPCYTVNAFLETVEEVDEFIALRSSSSITRATRRIQASCFENAICAQKLSLGFMIPTTATPDFRTSSVQLKWNLRVEFVVGRSSRGSYDEEGLLEEVNEDERGRILAAAQELHCESFDVLVPIRVYGGLGEAKESTVMSSSV